MYWAWHFLVSYPEVGPPENPELEKFWGRRKTGTPKQLWESSSWSGTSLFQWGMCRPWGYRNQLAALNFQRKVSLVTIIDWAGMSDLQIDYKVSKAKTYEAAYPSFYLICVSEKKETQQNFWSGKQKSDFSHQDRQQSLTQFPPKPESVTDWHGPLEEVEAGWILPRSDVTVTWQGSEAVYQGNCAQWKH